MMKMLIRLNEDKISSEGKYDINKIEAFLNSSFSKRGMTKDKNGWYINGDFSKCGSLIIALSHKDWFLDNVSEWLWYDTSDSSTEDLKEHYCKEMLGV